MCDEAVLEESSNNNKEQKKVLEIYRLITYGFMIIFLNYTIE
jgi:hypothetical protein